MSKKLVPYDLWAATRIDDQRLATAQRADDAKALVAALVAQDSAVQAALLAVKEQGSKADTANEKRFDQVNEFRNTLSDQAATFISRDVMDAVISNIDRRFAETAKDLSSLREYRSAQVSGDRRAASDQERGNWMIATFVATLAAIASIAGVVVLLLTHKP